jgi:ADP-ribose pyrophosphatase
MDWEVVSSEIMYRCGVFSVRRDASRSTRSGMTHDFHVLETRDWVNLVPVTADRRVVMVRQFRHGIRQLTLEVPAGVLDASDRSPAVAAARELREETGYQADEVVPLGVVHPNPALCNNRCHMFAAYDVVAVGAPQWDSTEEIGVEVVPLAAVPDLIRSGAISNALTLVAFQLFELAGRRP